MRLLNMEAQVVLWVLISSALAGAVTATYNNNNINPVPAGWEKMCTYRTDSEIIKLYTDTAATTGHVIRLQCHVVGNTEIAWHFQTLRDWLRGIPGISVFVDVSCSNGGQISLPWPMKANGVVGIVVSGCFLKGKYADFGNPDIYNIPDQLRVLEIRNSVWLSDGSGFDILRSPEGLANLTSEYDCGQDSTIEYMVTNNVSTGFELESVGSRPAATGLQLPGGFQFDLIRDLAMLSASVSDESETETRLQIPYQAEEWLDFDLERHEGEESVHSLTFLFNLNLPKPQFNGRRDNVHSVDELLNSNPLKPEFNGRRDSVHSVDESLNSNPPKPEFNGRRDSVHSVDELLNSNPPELAPENNTSSASDEFNQLLQSLLSLDVICNYEKLRILDESNPQLLPVDHFTLMVQGTRYPELRVMNYSGAGIREMPQELQDFRMYFPKLQYMDLSRNLLTKIPLTSRFTDVSGDFLTLDVRQNLIRKLSVDDLMLWAQNVDVFVDVRGNPFHCGCDMLQFLQRIKSESFFAGNLRRYKYIRDLQCASPSHLTGYKLSNVNLRCATATNLAAVPQTSEGSVAASSTATAIIIGCGAAIVATSFLALLLIIINIRAGKCMWTKHIVNKPQVLSQSVNNDCIINEVDLCTKL